MTKISKTLDTRFKELAKKLPAMHELDSNGNAILQPGTFKRKGSELLRVNPGMKDPLTGKQLLPNKFYKVMLYKWMNHHAELRKAYTLLGEQGVELYCKSIEAGFERWKAHQKKPITIVKNKLRKLLN